MTKTQQNFYIYQGQAKTITIPVYDADDALKVMTGGTPTWYAFSDVGDDIGDAVFSKTGGDISLVTYDSTANSAVEFTLDVADTQSETAGIYYHEVWVDPSGAAESLPVANGWMSLYPSPVGRG